MNELTWHRTKNAARRLLKNQMRVLVAKAMAADDEKWSVLVSFEEGAVKDAQEAYRKVLAPWASANEDPELRKLVQTALTEAADHVREHYEDNEIDADYVETSITNFTVNFDPEELLSCQS